MHLRGIHYDVGTETLDGSLTRPILTDEEIERDIGDIAAGLHANAIRITGGEIGRLASAGEVAVRRGLEVWLSPMVPNADAATTLARVAETAQVAEELRGQGHTVVVVVGCELSVFMAGILPGATHGDRLTLLSDPARLIAEVTAAGIDPQATFDGFLRQAVVTVRSVFRGQVTYAAGMWEEVDWTPFDLVGVDAYRDAGTRDGYASRLRGLSQHAKPVVVTETGCATFAGAADAGGLAWTAVDRSATPLRLREGIVRDEDGQARELKALLGSSTRAVPLGPSCTRTSRPATRRASTRSATSTRPPTRWFAAGQTAGPSRRPPTVRSRRAMPDNPDRSPPACPQVHSPENSGSYTWPNWPARDRGPPSAPLAHDGALVRSTPTPGSPYRVRPRRQPRGGPMPAYAMDFRTDALDAVCEAWTDIPAPTGPVTSITGRIPTLVMRGTLDPYSASLEDVRTVAGSNPLLRTLAIPDQSYNILGYDDCPRAIRSAWIDNPTDPPADTTCLNRIPKITLVSPWPGHTLLELGTAATRSPRPSAAAFSDPAARTAAATPTSRSVARP